MRTEDALGAMTAGFLLALVPALIIWQVAGSTGWAVIAWVVSVFVFCFFAFRGYERLR